MFKSLNETHTFRKFLTNSAKKDYPSDHIPIIAKFYCFYEVDLN